MCGGDNKTCLRAFVYICNSLLLAKGAAWIIFNCLLLFKVLLIDADEKGRIDVFSEPISLCLGIASLVFGIVGFYGTAKKDRPALVANTVFLILLFVAEVVFYIVLVILRLVYVEVKQWLLWPGAVSAVISLLSFSLTLAYLLSLKRSRTV